MTTASSSSSAAAEALPGNSALRNL
jgi:hypothetical protein